MFQTLKFPKHHCPYGSLPCFSSVSGDCFLIDDIKMAFILRLEIQVLCHSSLPTRCVNIALVERYPGRFSSNSSPVEKVKMDAALTSRQVCRFCLWAVEYLQVGTQRNLEAALLPGRQHNTASGPGTTVPCSNTLVAANNSVKTHGGGKFHTVFSHCLKKRENIRNVLLWLNNSQKNVNNYAAGHLTHFLPLCNETFCALCMYGGYNLTLFSMKALKTQTALCTKIKTKTLGSEDNVLI